MAIDVLDEVGARVHISNINVPEDIVALEGQIEIVKKEKNQVVKSQKYEEAAQLRDREKKLIDRNFSYIVHTLILCEILQLLVSQGSF